MSIRFDDVTDDELDELLKKARFAVKKAEGLGKKDRRQRKLRQANYYLDEIQREKEDRKGIGSEVVGAARKIANIGTFGLIDDNRYAEYAAKFNGTSVDEELERIAMQARESKDNRTSDALATAVGALSLGARNVAIAGQGATRLGTATRQGIAGALETAPFAYDALEQTKTYVQNKNLREGTSFDELSYRDFMVATGTIIAGGAAGALGGAIAGPRTTMKDTVDWASSPSSKPYTTTPQGGRTAADELADEPLDAVQAAANEAQPVMEQALQQARFARELEKENPAPKPQTPRQVTPNSGRGYTGLLDREATPGPAPEPVKPIERSLYEQEDLLEQIQDLESRYNVTEALSGGRPSRQAQQAREELAELKDEYARNFSGQPGVGRFSMLDEKPWEVRKTDAELEATQRNWRDASTLGEVVDAVTNAGKNFVKDKIWGVDMRLRWEISPELGGRYQMANTRSIRKLTNEVKQFVEPMDRVFKLNVEDPQFQAMLLDYGANSKRMSMERVKAYITNKLSAEDAIAFENYTMWSRQNSHDSLARFSGIKNPNILTRQHLHSKMTPAALERKKLEPRADYDDLEIPVDPATLKLNRNFYFDPDPMNKAAKPVPSDYFPVLQSDFRRILTNRLAVEVSEAFEMPLIKGQYGPEGYLSTMHKHFKDRGISDKAADYAVKQIKDHMIGVNRSPELWLQALNNGAYGYVLSGPKSALLNLHDPAMATVNFEVPLTEIPGALYRAYTNKAGADVIKSGIDQNLGEFVNQHIQTLQLLSKGGMGTQRWWADNTRKVTNQMMKIGQFERTDIWSKNGTLNVILEQMVREAKDGSFIPKWGFYMPPTKLNKLQLALKKNGANFKNYKDPEEFDLVEDMVFAALGQQQLIAGSGRSAAWARHPNLRPMWALRGFASQQQGILMWKTVDQWRKGNQKEAMKYLGMYATVVGTSFGLLNESRQWLFGDGNFDLTGVFMGMADQMVSTASVNTIGLNDYQWGRIMEVGVMQAFAESLVPIAADVPFTVGKNFVDTLQGDQGPLFPIGQIPLIKQTLAAPQNLIEDLSDNISDVTFNQVDVSSYIVDPQQEVLRRVGLLRQRNQE